MQSLGTLLRAGGRAGVDYSDLENVERYLLDAPPVDAVRLHLAEARQRLEMAPADSRAAAEADQDVGRLEASLEMAIAREEIASGRPAGCWCLGIGGRMPRYTQAQTKVFSELCGCPDGVAAGETQERLITAEQAAYHAAQASKLFGKAQVPSRFKDCTLETYPVDNRSRSAFNAIMLWTDGPEDGADRASLEQYSAARKKSLLLHGAYGVGKTGLAVGLLRREMVNEGGGLFFTVPTLLDHIRRTYGPSPIADEHELVQQVKSAPFLVLDDLGAERVTEWVREKLFTIINHRHDEDLPTVFTSNLDVAELGQHIGERTTWRIVEMCQVIHVDGPNLRNTGA